MRHTRKGLLLLAAVLLCVFCASACAEGVTSIDYITMSDSTRVGEPIHASVHATDALAYNFWLFDDQGVIVQEKTNTTDTSWSFTVNRPGAYLLRIYATNFVTYAVADTAWFNVEGDMVEVSGVRVSGDYVTGASLTATASVSHALAYNYWLFNDQGVIVDEHTNTTDTSWTFSISKPGIYLMRVYATNFVTDAHADSEWFAIMPDTPEGAPVTVGSVDLPTTNFLVGDTLSVNAFVGGGTGLYAYNYWVFNSSGAIVMEKTNTLDPYASFVLKEPGVYLLRLYATDFETDDYADSAWFSVSAVEGIGGELPASYFKYYTRNREVTIYGYTGPTNVDLVIPSTIGGYPVTTISDAAFAYRNDITGRLVIPSSVTTIGEGAFGYCSGLTGNLIIPDSVTSIGASAFIQCSGLSGTLSLPRNLKSIEGFTFYQCSGLTGVLNIPTSVAYIADAAFSNTGFTGSLRIPGNVKTVASFAFEGCSKLNGSLTIDSGVTAIQTQAFNQCSGLTGNLIIPDTVTDLGNNAFANCSSLSGGLYLSKGLTSLKNYTFYNCVGLTGDLTIPEGVTTIGDTVFANCGFNGRLSLPASLTSMGVTVFFGNEFSSCYAPAGSYAAQWLTSNGYTVSAE